jgi:hypothetical protein
MTYDNPYAASPPIAHSWNFVPYLPSPTPIWFNLTIELLDIYW